MATMTGSGNRKDDEVTAGETAIFAVGMIADPFCDPDRLARCHLEIK
jgi:hypothetical protein